MSLALALLTIQIYRHNVKKEASSLQRYIAAALSGVCHNNRQFGIVEKENGGVINTWFLRNSKNAEQVGGECELEENPAMISVDDIDHLLKKAIFSAELASSMCLTMKQSHKFSYLMMPFMSLVPSVFFRSSRSTLQEHAKVHAERLSSILDACNLMKHVVEGDGNCLFSAVAFGILNNLNQLSELHREVLKNVGLDLSIDVKNLALQLRTVMVTEWIDNSSRYEGFLVDVCIEQEALKFLAPGYFHGNLADTMVTALSNALQMPIIVYSSIACHPVLCVTPQTQKIPVPVMIAFTQFGPGHYDAIVPKQHPTSSNKDPVKLKCTCGKNAHNEDLHCHSIKCKYTTVCRCPCCKVGQACSDQCRCKNCNNPYGQRVSYEASKRKRFRHAWQDVKHVNSIEFAQSKLEELSSGPFTKLEYFLLDNIINYCNEEDIETTPENIRNLYMIIVRSISNTNSELPLSHKSEQEIRKVMDVRTKTYQFEELCHMQLEWNSSQETM